MAGARPSLFPSGNLHGKPNKPTLATSDAAHKQKEWEEETTSKDHVRHVDGGDKARSKGHVGVFQHNVKLGVLALKAVVGGHASHLRGIASDSKLK